MIYLRNVHPKRTVLVPLGAGWARMLRPAVTAELPERVLHNSAVRELLTRRMVELADGAAWNADTRQRRANRTDWARAIAAAEQREFDKLRVGLAAPRKGGHYWPAEQLEQIRQRLAAGATLTQLAGEYGLTRQALSGMCQRRGLLPGHTPLVNRRGVRTPETAEAA